MLAASDRMSLLNVKKVVFLSFKITIHCSQDINSARLGEKAEVNFIRAETSRARPLTICS